VSGVGAGVLGLLVLYGWQIKSAFLIAVVPGFAAMVPNAAAGMVLLGLALVCAERRGRTATVVGNVAILATLAIGCATMVEYSGMQDLGMARWLSALLTGMFGYLFSAEVPTKLAAYSTMALHTTIGFLMIGSGLLALRPSEGVMRDVTASQLGGRIFRAVLPAIGLLPPTLGAAILLFGQKGWYGSAFGLAIYTALHILVLAIAAWSAARWLNNTDRRRSHAELDNQRLIDELRQAQMQLEDKVTQRTRELTESEAKFRSLLELTSDWYWEQDERLRFTYVSPGYEHSTGLTAHESLGKTRWELTEPWISSEDRLAHESALAQRLPFRELYLKRRTQSGELRYVRLSGEPVFGAQGEFRGYRGVGRDVTAEKSRELNDQLLARIVQHTHDAIVSQSLDGTILTWNKAAERIYGYSAEEMLGKNASILFTGDGAAFIRDMNERVLQGDEGWEFTHQRRDKSGELLDVSVTISPIRDSSGRMIGVQSITRDLTGLARAHRALQDSQSRLSLALSIAGVETWEVEMASGRMRWSNGFGPIVGRPAGFQFPDRGSWRQSIHPRDRERATALFERAAAGELPYDIEFAVVWPDGVTERCLSSRCAFERDESGRAVRATGVMIDITERRRSESALRESELRFRRMADSAPVLIWTADADGVLDYINQRWLEFSGRSREEELGYGWTATVHPEDVRDCLSRYLQAAQKRAAFTLQLRLRRKDGQYRWFILSGVPRADPGGLFLGWIGSATDIHEQRMVEQALFGEKELAQVTLRSIGDAVITTDAQGRVSDLNPAAEALTGYSAAQAKARPVDEIFRLVDENTREPIVNPVRRVLSKGAATQLEDNITLIARDGSEHGVADSAAPIRDRDSQMVGVVLVFRDVTQQRHIARELRHQAAHDWVTGLINRREFEVRLEQALERAAMDGAEHALCYIDLDQFKIVNDTCGHAAGDDLLRQITGLLHEGISKRDTLARLGGDEFGLLLEHCSRPVAERIIGQLLQRLEAYRFVWNDHVLRIGASIGVVALTGRNQTLAEVLSAADSACYAAKEAGRNRMKFYAVEDEALLRRHGEMTWVSRINGALEEDRLELFVQDVMPLCATGPRARIYREILTRLREKDGTLTLPGAFIPAAERYDLMPRIDQLVVHKTIEWLINRPRQGECEPIYAINLSGLSLVQEGMLHKLLQLIRTRGVPPDMLCFELTETAAISNLAHAKRFIAELKALGCWFALDDFGAGMSSFSYLRNLHVDFLKIDGELVVNLLGEPVNRAMVDAIHRVGHTAGIATIAEWVEDDPTIDVLREIGIDYVQGFAIGQPQPLRH
jgi:diguanylate cyclase (GGDEF)-like protein/PAS domain S-box-containing protein